MSLSRIPFGQRQAAAALYLALAAGIGVLAWQSPEQSLLLLLLPVIQRQPFGRWWAALVALAYFGSGNAELPGLMARLNMGIPVWQQWLLAGLLTLIEAAPFALVHANGTARAKAGRMALALVLLTVPPIGLLSWRNPLLVAGMVFPGTGWFGILLTTGVLAVLYAGAHERTMRIVGAALLVLVIAAQARFVLHPPALGIPGVWSINTRVAPIFARDPLDLRIPPVMVEVGPQVEDALRLGAQVVVLPESILQPATPADEAVLRRLDELARRRGATVLVGQSLPTGPDRWRNAIVAYGAATGVLDESRVPMPVGNWWLRGGVPVRPFASDVVTLPVHGKPLRLGLSICYEDLILWPHRGLLAGQTDGLVSVANAWAVEGSRAERAQRVSVALLSRLAGVPLIRARNNWKTGW